MADEQEMPPVTGLFYEIVLWCQRQGVESLKDHPGLWEGETDEWNVKFNGHGEEVEGLPPYSAQLSHKVYLAFAVVDPVGGAVTGISEDELIAHFASAGQPEEAA